jgi:hypothetical protein
MIARRLAALVGLLVVAAPSVATQGAESPGPALLDARVVSASIDGLWLDRVDVSLRMAVRAGRDLTVRSVSFTDAFVESVPVWIAPLEGEWRLRAGQELQIPSPVLVSAHALDALGSDDLADIVRDGAVSVRATVEVAFATPWPARLLMQPGTQTAISTAEIRIPIDMGPSMLQPFARLGASVVDRVQQEASPFLIAGRNALPSNRTVLDRFERSIVAITTHYAIDASHTRGAAPLTRSIQTTGFWWTPGVLCTTREALEPWRFEPSDARLLQADGGRLRTQDVYARIESASLASSVEIDLVDLDRLLGALDERRVYVLANGTPRRIRLADREAPSNLACVRVSTGGVEGGVLPPPADARASSAATFVRGTSRGPVWTDVSPRDARSLTLRVPVHRYSFGSPLVTSSGVAGLVVSPTTAWNVSAVAAAAARAPHLQPRGSPVRGDL